MQVPPEILRIPQGCIDLDGSYGEGGGQIVRTACALSALTGITCKISQIRKGRDKPGLRPQHVRALGGLKQLCSARTTPLDVGTTEIEFSPGPLRGGRLSLDIGSAGSIGLILQCLMLVGVGLPEPLSVQIRGGTDVPGAPSCTYIGSVKVPLLQKMGYTVKILIKERGYIPRGGGMVHVEIVPAETLHAIKPSESCGILRSIGVSHASQELAPRQVAERQRYAAQKILTQYLHTPSKIESVYSRTRSIGSSLVIWAESADTVFGASCLGKRNMSGEQVAEKAAGALIRTYHSGASLDPWMGDQILPYMALAGTQSETTVPYVTNHMLTNIWVIQKFLNVRFYTEETQQHVRVICEPIPA